MPSRQLRRRPDKTAFQQRGWTFIGPSLLLTRKGAVAIYGGEEEAASAFAILRRTRKARLGAWIGGGQIARTDDGADARVPLGGIDLTSFECGFDGLDELQMLLPKGVLMKEAPPGFALDRLRATLRELWGIRARELEYLPVGFGAHHWRATDGSKLANFLALHDLGPDADVGFNKLTRALRTAYWLRTAGELEFVVAALRNHAGALVHRYAEAEALAVYPWLECRPRAQLDAPDVGRLFARLHAGTVAVPIGLVTAEDFAIPHRVDLERALNHLDQPWDTGPYGPPSRDRLRETCDVTRNLLAMYDRLADEALATRSDWVIGHGEPYGPNLVEVDDGRTMLVDWDSALLAPRERDLWEVPSNGPALRTYTQMTGVSARAARLRLYRAWYHLAETGIYVHEFRSPHTGDLNDAEAWTNFVYHLPSDANWPELG